MNITRKDLLKTGIALAYITLLITSSIVLATASIPKSIDAQSACQRLPIASASASAETNDFPAANVIDSDLGTRWHYERIGAYIQTDLGKLSTVCSVDIAWYKGDLGASNYLISVSDNGKDFVNLLSGKSAGNTLSPERYNVPDVAARYVRVAVNGNEDNDWAAINEISVNGQTGSKQMSANDQTGSKQMSSVMNRLTNEMSAMNGPTSCASPQTIGITATGNDGNGNIPQNTIDNSLFTRWSNPGLPSQITYDLGAEQPICSIDIAWYRGNMRTVTFTVSVSNDGVNFRDIIGLINKKSSGNTVALEPYNISPPVSGKYVRITVTGNTEINWASITEVAINKRGQAPVECKPPQIMGITATGNDGNIPQNTIDNSLSTRWSNFGFPSQITYDLGAEQPICSIDIAWYRGNMRIMTFTVSVSNDGVNFQDITSLINKKSSGNTVALEPYNISPPVSGKYVRITVTGNTEINWASITEVAINKRGQAPAECKPPQITDMAATGDDGNGNIPQNTIDNSLSTRWSNPGLPSQIIYDLGAKQPICSIDIAWYRGNMRTMTFTVSVSNDGVNFQDITSLINKKSSGNTVALEPYNISPPVSGKYVRITVTGNTEINWASITEVAINKRHGNTSPEICNNGIDDDTDGKVDSADPDCSQTPPVGNEICNNGIDDDRDGKVDSADPDCSQTPPGGSEIDPFGIRKIYPTKTGSERDEWYMDMLGDGRDPRSTPPSSLRKNTDGSFKVTDTQVRFGVFTTSGYDGNDIDTLDHGEIAEKGYMQSPNDYRDVEMTGYVKVNSGQSDENFAWYARGGRHTGSGNPEGCEGSAYKADLFYDGRTRFAKEQWHVSYVFTDDKGPFADPSNDWVGFKTMMWNIVQSNGQPAVKMEIWVDRNDDGNEDGPWVKVDENIDSGGWGDEGSECGGEDDQIITWGGPIATFRWDGATNVDLKNFSVREIRPTSQ